jgi:hypothetical protein
MYDYLDLFAGYRRLSADSFVLFGFLDDGWRLLLWLLRLLLLQLLTVSATPVGKRVSTSSRIGG